jgi:hypothetical protein
MFRVTRKGSAPGETPAHFSLDAGEIVKSRKVHKPEPIEEGKSQVLRNFKAKVEREEAKRYIEGTRAQYPSEKQVNFLAYLLDFPGKHQQESFVRFANGYYNGEITRIHYVNAINLMTKGFCHYGNAVHLVKMSMGNCDVEDNLHDGPSELQPDAADGPDDAPTDLA